ncbi:MAG: acyl carrier protein [Acidobacteria bacterium]|nr:acyl carrier protein [Acidobacteriota bacterium]
MSQPVFNNGAQTLTARPAREDVELAVRTAIAGVLERPVDEILPESDLEKDLGLDSLGIIEASISIEERFHIPVLDLGSPKFTFNTVNDLTVFVAGLMGIAPSEKEEQQPC